MSNLPPSENNPYGNNPQGAKPNIAAPNPYASPQVAPAAALPQNEGMGVWRIGKLLLAANHAQLPTRCVKCNAPAIKMLPQNYSWHHPALLLFRIWGARGGAPL